MAKSRRRSRRKPFIILLFIFFVVIFFGAQYLTKTGLFHVRGTVFYDESLNEEELAKLRRVFTDEVSLNKDLYASAENYFEKPILKEGEFLEEILVPVADFYSDEDGVVFENMQEFLDSDIDLISVDDLDFSKKLLMLNGEYYLDEFDSGAIFRVIKFSSEKYIEEVSDLVSGSFLKVWPEKENVLTFAQTGVTALSRGMNAKMQKIKDGAYFAEKIGEYLSGFDLTHTSNESSFSDYASSKNICSDARFIDTLLGIGLDIVELTGNHNQDCGDEAARNSIDAYIENGIRIVGGGKTATEAKKPLEIDEKNSKITMLAYNYSTGGATEDDTPGANQYYEEEAKKEIAEAKARDDLVIVDVQYYECNAYDSTTENRTCDYADSAAGNQIGFFRNLIDLGADIVVGTSAHQPQTFELYGDGVIYYGLGNLFFDQVWWPGTTRSLILAHYIYNGKILQTKIMPTVYDEKMQTELMDKETAKWFIKRLKSAKP